MAAQAEHWVGTWAAAPQLVEPTNLPPRELTECTLRQIVYVSIGASRMRLKLSNAYGNGPLTIGGAGVAVSTSGHEVDPASCRPFTFSGKPAATIPTGETLSSDPLDFALNPQAKVAITLALGSAPNDVTGHPGSRTTSYIAAGNVCSSASFSTPVETDHWYYIAGIDVVADATSGAIVALGDSITDGRGSTTNGNDRWPDNLSRRLRANAKTATVSMLNLGVGGNAVLSGGLGPTAMSRFQRDVLQQSGARWVIVLHGVNDIGVTPSLAVAHDLIAAYRQLVAAGRERGLRIYGVPILPTGGSHYDCPEHQAARTAVNAWIRAPGNFDALIDLDAAVRDPENPTRLLPAYDSGDQLHLSAAGYRRMADAIDLGLFT